MSNKNLAILGFCFFIAVQLHAQGILETSNLPIIIIQTEGPIVDEPKVFGNMAIIDNGPNQVNNINDTPNDYNGTMAIELRGQTSQQIFDKKSYGIELRTPANEDSSAVVLGFPSEEDWVLHGPFSDKSLMRNWLTFKIWDKMGWYGSRVRFCEVVINNDYKGVYVFMEQIKRDGDRVDISRLNEDENSGDDLTGGYIVKIDKTNPGEEIKAWDSRIAPPNRQADNQKITFYMDYPRPEEITDPQFEYIQNYMHAFEAALQSPNFADPIAGWRSLAFEASFIDYALLSEINRNVDSYRLSTFMYKDKDSDGGKLIMGPPWDYNLAFGNANYCQGNSTEGWGWDFNFVCPGDFWLNPFWWNAFLRDPGYVSNLKQRWQELRANELSDAALMALIDEGVSQLDGPQQRNFTRWPILGQEIWPNSFVGQSFEEEVGFLRSWLQDRVSWMDQAIADLSVVTSTGDLPQLNMEVYPNPTKSTLNIKAGNRIGEIKIFTMTGQLVYSNQPTVPLQNLSVQVSQLTPGKYILGAWLDNGTLESRLIIVE